MSNQPTELQKAIDAAEEWQRTGFFKSNAYCGTHIYNLLSAAKERDQLKDALEKCARAVLKAYTLSGSRSEPYIPSYVRDEIESVLNEALSHPSVQAILKGER